MAADDFEMLNFEDDLALFTNTEFFDFDMDQPGSLMPPPSSAALEYDAQQEERARRQNASGSLKRTGKSPFNDAAAAAGPQKPLHINTATNLLEGDFQFDDFSNMPNVVHDQSMASMTTSPTSHYSIATTMSPLSSTTPTSSTAPFVGKRKSDPLSDPNSAQALEEATRLAAEEDKRRRNTAASARFRVKKKQREHALEKQARDMHDKVSDLEKKVGQLETENKWLKGLITEKNENRSDVTEMYKRFTREGSEPRSSGGRTDGVGTVSKSTNANRA